MTPRQLQLLGSEFLAIHATRTDAPDDASPGGLSLTALASMSMEG